MGMDPIKCGGALMENTPTHQDGFRLINHFYDLE